MKLQYKELMSAYRNQGSCDDWAESMSAFFAVATEAFLRGLDVPTHWQFRPAPGLKKHDKDDWFAVEITAHATDEALIRFGNLMERYTRLLDRHGKSY
jgi:hypothetical protein